MGYVERVLQPGEELVYRSRIHWFVYMGGLALLVIAGLAWWAGMRYAPPDVPPTAVDAVGGLIALWGLLVLLAAWIRRMTTELAVTSRRIIYKRGLVRRYTIEMNMDKVESVDVNQSILGRIFDFGDITVRGTGEGLQPLRSIDAPLEFRNHVTAG